MSRGPAVSGGQGEPELVLRRLEPGVRARVEQLPGAPHQRALTDRVEDGGQGGEQAGGGGAEVLAEARRGPERLVQAGAVAGAGAQQGGLGEVARGVPLAAGQDGDDGVQRGGVLGEGVEEDPREDGRPGASGREEGGDRLRPSCGGCSGLPQMIAPSL